MNELIIGRLKRSLLYGSLVCEFTGSTLNILRDVNEYGTRTAGLRDPYSLSYRICKIFYIMYQEVVLRDGKSDTRDIDLLETVSSDKGIGNVTRYGKKRYGIKISSSDTRDEVRRSGT